MDPSKIQQSVNLTMMNVMEKKHFNIRDNKFSDTILAIIFDMRSTNYNLIQDF